MTSTASAATRFVTMHRTAPPHRARRPAGRDRLWCGLGLGLALCLWCPGCGYIVGNPFPPSIRSVHVATFTNDTYRRGYELLLTEAVQKQIMLRTPFRLTSEAEADTILTGHIRTLDKRLTNQSRYDDPRELELQLGCEIRWRNARTGETLGQQVIPISTATAHVLATSGIAPEPGQSQATATHELVNTIARQVVGLMEATW